MSINADYPKVVFPDNFDEMWKADVLSKEYFALAKVVAEDGSQYSVFFISSHRLQQELKDTSQKSGQSWFAEPGLIVLYDFTFANMKVAVASLWNEGYFASIRSET